MNNIKLSHYPHGFIGSVKTKVNGVELKEVVTIDLHCPVDGLPQLTVTQNIYSGLDVTLNGIVEPTVNLLNEGLELVVEQDLSANRTRYWARRRTK